jgi:putative ABC transport system ATP-binding protein
MWFAGDTATERMSMSQPSPTRRGRRVAGQTEQIPVYVPMEPSATTGRHAVVVGSEPPDTSGPDVVAAARELTKRYGAGDTAVVALDSVDIDFGRGQFTAIMGPSGSGKSTLMHCMAGLDRPTDGQIWVDGQNIVGLSQRELTKLRRTRIGFVFQSYNLVPTLTAAENITLPLEIAARPIDQDWFDVVVETLGLGDRLTHRPSELSGGQQQRVACARALIARPAVVFADEPTGNLDSKAAAEVLDFLRAGADDMGQSIVLVTHDPTAASYAHRIVFLGDGKVVGELHNPTVDAVLDAIRVQ